jgi:hypothetical protein
LRCFGVNLLIWPIKSHFEVFFFIIFELFCPISCSFDLFRTVF